MIPEDEDWFVKENQSKLEDVWGFKIATQTSLLYIADKPMF